MMDITDKTLANNKVNQFILRIDFEQQLEIDLKKLAEELLPNYDSMVSEDIVEYNVTIPKAELSAHKYTRYVLKTENGRVRLKLNEQERSIIIDSDHYDNNLIYKGRIEELISCLKKINLPDIKARRIGLRYINTFPCSKQTEIYRIIKKPFVASIIKSLEIENVNRSIQIVELTNEDYSTRIQYGIPNKFYPSKLVNYDAVLDIDIYFNGLQSIDEWEECIRKYNHAAYDTFIYFLEPSFIDKLR